MPDPKVNAAAATAVIAAATAIIAAATAGATAVPLMLSMMLAKDHLLSLDEARELAMGPAKGLPLPASPSLLLVLAAVARLVVPMLRRERMEGLARAVWVASSRTMVRCTPAAQRAECLVPYCSSFVLQVRQQEPESPVKIPFKTPHMAAIMPSGFNQSVAMHPMGQYLAS